MCTNPPREKSTEKGITQAFGLFFFWGGQSDWTLALNVYCDECPAMIVLVK